MLIWDLNHPRFLESITLKIKQYNPARVWCNIHLSLLSIMFMRNIYEKKFNVCPYPTICSCQETKSSLRHTHQMKNLLNLLSHFYVIIEILNIIKLYQYIMKIFTSLTSISGHTRLRSDLCFIMLGCHSRTRERCNWNKGKRSRKFRFFRKNPQSL